jgi:pimeloyl-ACP methyl ester carboxylesterase
MQSSLIVLHGYTMNGETMRGHMSGLASRFADGVNVVYASAPQHCSASSVDRFYGGSTLKRSPPPYLRWWDSTDDGTEYRGWEAARESVRALVTEHGPAGVLGFSQGAILASMVAAWSERGEIPPLRFVILVAGRVPRATALQPLFEKPIRVPSLHIWGERDGMADGSRELVTRFDEATREVATWNGTHRVPIDGPAADAIVAIVRRGA